MEILSNDWLIGFIEGEGHFAIENRSRRPRFVLVQAEREVLEKIQKYLGFGKIYIHSRIPNHKMAYQYVINRLDDIKKFRELLENQQFHSESKKQQFLIWCNKMDTWKSKRSMLSMDEKKVKYRNYMREYMRNYNKTH